MKESKRKRQRRERQWVGKPVLFSPIVNGNNGSGNEERNCHDGGKEGKGEGRRIRGGKE